jgi:ribosome-binding factor A
MSKSTKRADRVADLIRRQISTAMLRTVSDPRLVGVSVTAVKVTPDLGRARIYFTVHDKETVPEVTKALKHASGYIRHLLAEGTELKYTPQLDFIYDETIVHAEKLAKLIDEKYHDDPKD